jgi:hypothetical protein
MNPWSGGRIADESIEDPVAVLMAIEEIRLLKARYFQAVDDKDYDTIADVFTDDADIDFSGEPVFHIGHHGVTEDVLNGPPWMVVGGEEAGRVIAGAVQDIVTVHHGHDPRIFLTSLTTAVGRWSLYDRLEYPDETMHGFGYYEESYVRENGRWKISELVLRRHRVTWEPTADL